MPNEQIASFKGDARFRIELVPSIMQRYLSINTTVKPFNEPGRLGFSKGRRPAEGCRPFFILRAPCL